MEWNKYQYATTFYDTIREMRISWSSLFRILLTVALTVLGILFFRSTHGQLQSGYEALKQANLWYVLLSLLLTALAVTMQAQTIRFCYRTIRRSVDLLHCLNLYLKRFFLSPFIPGGFSVAQYTMSHELEQYGITSSENAFVSTVYVLTGSCTYILILIISLIFAGLRGTLQTSRFYSILLIFTASIIVLILLLYLFRKELLGRIRQWLHPYIGNFDLQPLLSAFLGSFVVDLLGILILWSSLRGVGHPISFEYATLGYIITILIITLSPFFQGLVVVEGALVYTLKEFGVPPGPAFAGAIVFRTFQLWIPLLVGGIVYVVPNVLRWLHSGHSKLFRP